MTARVVAAALVALVACAAPFLRDACAAEDPADAVDEALRRIHASIAGQRWAEGEAGVRALFTEHRGAPRVRARLREIEDALQLCLYRKETAAPDARTLFGSALKRFVPGTLEIELQYEEPVAPDWTFEEDVSYLSLRFDAASIEFTPVFDELEDDVGDLVVLMLVDPQKGTGCCVVPYLGLRDWRGARVPERASLAVSLPLTFGDPIALARCELKPDATQRLLVSRMGSAVALRRGPKMAFGVQHPRRWSGFVGVMGPPIRDVRVKGRLEAAAYQRAVADRLAEDFVRWRDEEYDRVREVPAWARLPLPEDADATLGLLPSDGRFLSPDQAEAIVQLALQGDEEGIAWAEAVAGLSEPLTASYLHGIAEFAGESWPEAVERFDAVLAAEPDFAPAVMFRALALIRSGLPGTAEADLLAVVKRHPRAAWAHLGLVEIAFDALDFDRAFERLSAAAKCAGQDEDLEELAVLVHRARTGPVWPRRFRRESARFAVESDQSEKACADVAAALEKMQAVYQAALGAARPAAAKARVYVFASEDGYRDHTAELAMDAESTAGAYSPLLRTTFLFVPSSPDELWATVRHEGFHQYLARIAPSVPDWLNEGWAQLMEEKQKTRAETGWDPLLELLYLPRFVPVAQLVALDHESFMERADVHYVQSRCLMEFLLESPERRFASIPRAYVDALRAGASRAQADAKVLAPVLPALDAAFTAWVAERSR